MSQHTLYTLTVSSWSGLPQYQGILTRTLWTPVGMGGPVSGTLWRGYRPRDGGSPWDALWWALSESTPGPD